MASCRLLLIAIMAGAVFMLNTGSKTGIALGIALIVSPVATYLAIRQPILFPFGLYVVLIPFDHLLLLPQFGTLTRLLAIASGAALALSLVRKKQFFAPGWSLAIWGMFVLWAAASFIWAIDVSPRSVSGFATLLQLFLLFAVLSLTRVNDQNLKLLLFCVILGALAAAAFGLYLFHGGGQSVYAGRLFLNVGSGPAPLGEHAEGSINPNEFAAAMLLPIALALMKFLESPRVLQKLTWSLALLVLLGGIVVSGSRGSLLAVAALVPFFFWKTRYKGQLLALSTLVGIGSIFVSSIWERFSTALSSGGAGRLEIWIVGVAAFKQYWLLGAGNGEFADAYNRAYISVFQQISAHWSRAPHNIVLGTAVELGVIGLILLTLALFSQYKMLDAVIRRDPFNNTAVALQGALVSLLVASQFLDSITTKYTWLLFSIIMLTSAHTFQNRTLSNALAADHVYAPLQSSEYGVHPAASKKAYILRS